MDLQSVFQNRFRIGSGLSWVSVSKSGFGILILIQAAKIVPQKEKN